jgi:hypothetical protein
MVIGWFRIREPHPSNTPALRLCLVTDALTTALWSPFLSLITDYCSLITVSNAEHDSYRR